MAFLMSAVADLIHDPGGLWEILILKVFKFIGSYGWRILFFTVCLKLLLFPLDLYQRIKMRKNQLITERIKPQMEKLQQQYAGDKQTLAQKQMELNKREGFSYFSSCLPMIVTLVVFFYLLTGLNNISRYQNLKQYIELYDAYTAVETVENDVYFNASGFSGNITYNILDDERAVLTDLQPRLDDYRENDNWKSALSGEAAYGFAVKQWNDGKPDEAKYRQSAGVDEDGNPVLGEWLSDGETVYNYLVDKWKASEPNEADFCDKKGNWVEDGEAKFKAAVADWKASEPSDNAYRDGDGWLKQGKVRYDAALAAWQAAQPVEADYRDGDGWKSFAGSKVYADDVAAWEAKRPADGDTSAWEATRPVESEYKVGDEWLPEGFFAYRASVGLWGNNHQSRYDVLTDAMNLRRGEVKSVSQDAAVSRYLEVEDSFLWVSNIWSPDVPWKKSILDYKTFDTNINKYKDYEKAAKKLKIDKSKLDGPTYSTIISEAKYNDVTEKLTADKKYNHANGYLILPILSVGLSFLSQFITSRLQKQSGQASADGSMGGSMKMMMFIMPIMMGVFALTYTAMFTLYIVVNSAMTILINVITTLAMNGKTKSKEKKQTTTVQKYGRPDPKDL